MSSFFAVRQIVSFLPASEQSYLNHALRTCFSTVIPDPLPLDQQPIGLQRPMCSHCDFPCAKVSDRAADQATSFTHTCAWAFSPTRLAFSHYSTHLTFSRFASRLSFFHAPILLVQQPYQPTHHSRKKRLLLIRIISISPHTNRQNVDSQHSQQLQRQEEGQRQQ